ncbi:hypothetical protein GDO78_019453 [Eleutherodactylus coqui]|uniref:Uncharacterized protein n=1 Tax=Eleutherodactylus coqui TaxID=57060 RepID=A0A8J6JQC2_ELECQ|nr:hypothetical protein GDO78_019453 [Eleutherodactylus coqui]
MTNNPTTTEHRTLFSIQTNGRSKTTLSPNDLNTSNIITSSIFNTPTNRNTSSTSIFTTTADRISPTAATNNTTTAQSRTSSMTQNNGGSKTTQSSNDFKNTSYISTSITYSTPTNSSAQQTNTTANENSKWNMK